MEYTNKVVKFSAIILIACVFLTAIFQTIQTFGEPKFLPDVLKIFLFLYPIPFIFFYFRKRSGKSLGINILLLAITIFATVGLLFKYYLYPFTH